MKMVDLESMPVERTKNVLTVRASWLQEGNDDDDAVILYPSIVQWTYPSDGILRQFTQSLENAEKWLAIDRVKVEKVQSEMVKFFPFATVAIIEIEITERKHIEYREV